MRHHLGPAITTVTASTGSSSSTASATVTVTDGEEPDATLATATPLAPSMLNLGYMTSATDINDWSVTVNQSQELALALTNLPAQYDSSFFSGPTTNPGLTVPAATGGRRHRSQLERGEHGRGDAGRPGHPRHPAGRLPALRVANVPAAASGLDGANAGAQYIQTPPLDAGTYVVQVSGYNGATSPQPYLLRAALAGGGPSPTCPPLDFPHPEPPPSSSLPAMGASVNTLFLVDTQRLSAAFGAAAEAAVISDVEAVAGDTAAGVDGAVVPVDAYPWSGTRTPPGTPTHAL